MAFDLDNLSAYASFDPDDMRKRIKELPEQLREAWWVAQDAPLPDDYRSVRRVVVVGMGGSAIGGDLLAALMERDGTVPLEVARGYDLPAYVQGPETLVVGSSYSGNTEETLSAFEAARKRGVRLIAITTGGRLAEMAEDAGAPVWRFHYDAQPRAALGYSFTLLLGLLSRLGFYPDPAEALENAAQAVKVLQKDLLPDVPEEKNPAKQMARALHEKIPAIFGAGFLIPVARRWKDQFHENADQWALWDELPELNHNLVVGFARPEKALPHLAVVFLRSPLDHPRINVRWNVTGELLERSGVAYHEVSGSGESALSQMLTLIHFGDYVSYYVTALNGVDPTPVENINYLKARLSEV